MNKDIRKQMTEVNAAEMCRRIEVDSETQAQDILSRAKKEAARILEESRQTAEREKEAMLRQADKDLSKLRERITSSLNLEKKKVVMAEKEKFVESVLLAVKKEAESFRESREYTEFLKREIVDGVKVVNDLSVDIYYSFQDERIFSGSFRDELQAACRSKIQDGVSLHFVKADFKDIGIIVQSRDGRLISDRRFLSFLKTTYEDVYMRLLKEAG